MNAARAWLDFVEDPGPVVIGSTQLASCFGAEYEVAFQHRPGSASGQGLRHKVSLTFFTAEPFLGHFGIDGMRGGTTMLKTYFRMLGIEPIANVSTTAVTKDSITLSNGRTLPHKYAIVIPPFTGVQAVLDSPGVGDARGFVPVNLRFQHVDHPNIFAAGVAVQIQAPAADGGADWSAQDRVGCPRSWARSPRTTSPRLLPGADPEEKAIGDIAPLCILDGGNQGVIIALDHVFKPRRFEAMLPGPWAHWAKLAFEKYYMTKMKNGLVYLP